MINFLIRFILVSLGIIVIFLVLALIYNFYISNRPNVILITIETTRADHVSCYGYKRETTPTIDKLASEGVLFSNMFVQRGQTGPSLTSIMTSLYPVNHGVRKNGHMLSPSVISLAEILRQNKYICAAFLAYATGYKWRGFDLKVAKLMKDSELTQDAITWLKNNYNNNFFLWIHYCQPHDPYDPPEPYKSMFDPDYAGNIDGSSETFDKISKEKTLLSDADLNHIISLYDGCIYYVDEQISKILGAVKTLGVENNTLLIITADHGENLYHPQFYFGHDASIHDDVLKVPYIMRFPKRIPKNIQIDKIVESIDIAPTILGFLKIKIPRHFEGRSLLPLVFQKKNVSDFEFAYAEWRDKILSIRTNKYRYVYNPKGYCPMANGVSPFIVEEEELHSVSYDYQEVNNILRQKPNVAKELKRKLLEWDNFYRWRSGYDKSADENIPKDILEHLRSLGYN